MPTERQISKVKAAIVAELARQIPNIYFWDNSDAAMFDGGPITWTEFERVGLIELADKFDLDAVAIAAIRALEDPFTAKLDLS